MEVLATARSLYQNLLLQHPALHDATHHPYAVPTAVAGLLLLLLILFFRPAKPQPVVDDSHVFVKFAQQRAPQVLADLIPVSAKSAAASSPATEELAAHVARLAYQVHAIQHELSQFIARRAAVEEELIDATNKIFRLLTDDHRSVVSSEELELPPSNFRPPPSPQAPVAPFFAAPPPQPQQQPQATPPQQSPVQPPAAPAVPFRVPQFQPQPIAAQPQIFAPQAPSSQPSAPQPSVAQVQPPAVYSQEIANQQTPPTGSPPAEALDVKPPQWRPSVPTLRPPVAALGKAGAPGGLPGGFLRPPGISAAPTPEIPKVEAKAARPRPQAKAIVAVADPFASRA